MKSVVGLSLFGNAAAVQLGAFAGLEGAIKKIQELQADYTAQLSEVATTAAKYQEACRIKNENTAAEIDKQEEIASASTQAAAEYAKTGFEAGEALRDAQKNLQKETERGEESTKSFEQAQKEHEAFLAETQPVIESLQNAEQFLRESLTSGESFVQIPKEIKALVQQHDDLGDLNFDDADAAAGQQNGVTTILKLVAKLLGDSREMMQKKVSEFTTLKHNHEVTLVDVSHLTKDYEYSIEKSTKAQTQAEAEEAKHKAQYAEATRYEEELEENLETSKSECATKDEADKQTMAEIRAASAACATAVESLSARQNAHYSLAQGSSFLQLHRSMSGDNIRDEISNELFTVAKRFSSPAISNIAMQVQAGGPFDKVTEMINSLIKSLQEQAQENMDFHTRCNSELDGLDADILTAETDEERYEAQLEANNATIVSTTQELKDLKSAQATEESQFQAQKAASTDQINEQQSILIEIEDTNNIIGSVLDEFAKELVGPTKERAEPVVAVLNTILVQGQQSETETKQTIAQQKSLLTELTQSHDIYQAEATAQIDGATKTLKNAQAATSGLEEALTEKQAEVESKKKTRDTKFTICNGGTRQEKFEAQQAGREKEIADLQQVLDILMAQ